MAKEDTEKKARRNFLINYLIRKKGGKSSPSQGEPLTKEEEFQSRSDEALKNDETACDILNEGSDPIDHMAVEGGDRTSGSAFSVTPESPEPVSGEENTGQNVPTIKTNQTL